LVHVNPVVGLCQVAPATASRMNRLDFKGAYNLTLVCQLVGVYQVAPRPRHPAPEELKGFTWYHGANVAGECQGPATATARTRLIHVLHFHPTRVQVVGLSKWLRRPRPA
jgi:hypothetical protein